MPVTSLVGAQWGSEGKGVFAAGLAYRFDAAVRVGGPNAGHSIWHDGEVYKMRSVPCAWVNPACELYIGAGAVVNPELLVSEAVLTKRVINIDPVAVLITHEDEAAERELVKLIGSTGEGVGQARIKRILRDGTAKMAATHDWPTDVQVLNVRNEVYRVLARGGSVFFEGTQGSGLSLFHGTKYPKATSEDTNVQGLFSAVGIPFDYSGHVQLVARTYPIRVAGDSGPMGNELTWDWFAEQGIVDKPEITTVSLKVRRVAEWFQPVYDNAVAINHPCGVWVSFGDYLAPELRGTTDWHAVINHPKLGEFLERRESEVHFGLGHVPVLGVGMGPDETGAWRIAQPPLPMCRHGESWTIRTAEEAYPKSAQLVGDEVFA